MSRVPNEDAFQPTPASMYLLLALLGRFRHLRYFRFGGERTLPWRDSQICSQTDQTDFPALGRVAPEPSTFLPCGGKRRASLARQGRNLGQCGAHLRRRSEPRSGGCIIKSSSINPLCHVSGMTADAARMLQRAGSAAKQTSE
jgi:hypothetical protein